MAKTLEEIFGSKTQPEGGKSLQDIFGGGGAPTAEVAEQPQLTRGQQIIQQKSAFRKTADVAGTGLKAGAEFISPAARGLLRPFAQFKSGIETLVPGGKTGREGLKTPFGKITPGAKGEIARAGFEVLDLAFLGLPVGKLATKPLRTVAERLFGSAIKAKDIKTSKINIKAKDVIATGLDERILATRSIMDSVQSKIDEAMGVIDEAIEQGKATGQKIQTEGLIEFMEDTKEFFKSQVDVKGAKEAIKEIDDLTENFLIKFGESIPIEVAQTIKKRTNTLLRKKFGELTTASVEGQKAINRFLKEGILDKAPIVGEANKRVKNLIDFERFARNASNSISGRNLLGLPTKLGGAIGGVPGAIAGKLLELADSPALKSVGGIAVNELAKLAEKGVTAGKIPAVALLNFIADIVNRQAESDARSKK